MILRTIAIAASLLLSAHAAFATTSVNANNAPIADLGSFSAGTYTITASGSVDLVGDGSFTMNPDGTPKSVVTTPGYSYFNPSGSVIADGAYGFAGAGVKIGALAGTFSSSPGVSDWFTIGYSKQVTLVSAGHIYAAVNDTYSPNNAGVFLVNVTAVPEPESYALLLAGLGLIGAVARRKNKLQRFLP